MPTHKIVEDRKEFNSWFGGFDPDRETDFGWVDDRNTFFDHVQEKHQKIRNILGGVSKTENVKIATGYDPKVVLCQIRDNVDSALAQISGYLAEYKLKKEDLYVPIIDKFKIKTIKHMLTYAKRSKIDSSAYAYLESVCNSLGNNFAKAKTAEGNFYVTISTAANAFAKLGHYGVDAESCFKQTSDNCSNKYILGASSDTYVVTIGTSKPIGDNTTNNVCRAWGFLGKARDKSEEPTFNICNYYKRSDILTEGTTIAALKDLVKKTIDKDNVMVLQEKITVGDGIWHNSSPDWTFTTEQYIDDQHLEPGE